MDDHDASYYRVGNTPGWKPVEAEQKRIEVDKPMCLLCQKAAASYRCDGLYLCKTWFQAAVKVPPYSDPTVWVEPQDKTAPRKSKPDVLPFLLGLACGILGGVVAPALMR